MIDVIAPTRSSLRLGLVEATVFSKLNMSMFLNNSAYVVESPIWNTLIPSRLELLDGIGDSDSNNWNEEDVDEEEDDDLSLEPIESEEANFTCWF